MIDFDALVLGPCMGVFGDPVTFQPAAGPQLAISGVWNEKYTEITFTDGNPVSSTKPVLGCRASDFGANQPQQNDVFAIHGRLWAVDDVQPDGMGHLHLAMRLANDAQRSIPATPPA